MLKKLKFVGILFKRQSLRYLCAFFDSIPSSGISKNVSTRTGGAHLSSVDLEGALIFSSGGLYALTLCDVGILA